MTQTLERVLVERLVNDVSLALAFVMVFRGKCLAFLSCTVQHPFHEDNQKWDKGPVLG